MMDNQNPILPPPVQFPIPVQEPIQPTPLPQPPIETAPQPIIQTPQVETTPPRKNKKIIIIAIIFVFLIISAIGIFVFVNIRSVNSVSTTFPTSNTSPEDTLNTSTADATTVVSKEKLRNPKLTIAEVEQVPQTVKNSLGVMATPNESIFVHTETYKGIPIKWTQNQPIPAERLQWLKNAIDQSPDFYTKDHPPAAIMSMTFQEAGMSDEQATLNNLAVAAASGTNIYLWPLFVKPNSDSALYAPVDETYVRYVLMHEWMHICQYYESVSVFSDYYLTHEVGGLLDMNNKSPFVQNFSLAVGWYFKPDWITPTLKDDSESQKTTSYGKFMMYEDMAESAAHVITCDTSMLSQARIDKMSEMLGRSAQSFCQ